MNNLLNKHVVRKKLTKKQLKNKPWITKEIKKSIIQRDKLLKKYTKEKDQKMRNDYYKEYKILRNSIVNALRVNKRNHLKNFFNRQINNSKNVWKSVRELISSKSFSPRNNLLNINGKIETKPALVAEEFNSFFTNITEKIRRQLPPLHIDPLQYVTVNMRNSFFFNAITADEILKVINTLDQSKSNGLFSIPPKLLRLLSRDISYILADVFNISIQTGKFIRCLKTSKVSPIYKNKGSELDVSNYRPISLLSNIDKIFEKLVHERLMNYLTQEKILYNRQFGFRKKHSTIHNLIALSEEVRENLDKGNYTYAVFLDLQKAFDSVDHDILIKKLYCYGIRGIFSDWIKSFLTERKQFVSINGIDSTTREIKYGVPQGSVLGPLLFLIYINDLQNALLYSKSFIFADDTAIIYSDNDLRKIKKRMNIDLKLLSNWLNSNKIFRKMFGKIKEKLKSMYRLT